MTVNGFDVAGYQDTDYATSGVDFIFVKATEGTGYINPKHDAQVAHGRSHGLIIGHYHFVRPGSMSAQVDYFLDHARPQPHDMLCLDWEDPDVTGAQKDAFLKYLTAKTPQKSILYANRDFWLHRDSTSYCADGLWIADPSAPKGHPRVEHPWLFHQYSSAGGIDHNVGAFADRAALAAWTAGNHPSPQQEDDMPSAEDLWDADVIPAIQAGQPNANSDAATNKTWRAKYAQFAAVEAARGARAAAEAADKKLAALDAKVSAIHIPEIPTPQIDYAQLAAALIAAIASKEN